MKLAIMKAVCLLAFVSGLFMLGLVLDVNYAQIAYEYALEHWPQQESGELNLRIPGAIFGILLIAGGLYGVLPIIPSKRNAVITFKGPNGDIVLQLRPIQKVLLKMMRRMPEVYTIKVDVRPDNDGRRARIDADVVLQNCAALGARQCAKIVAACLTTTAQGLLGLEDLSAVCVNVKGVHVDVAATGKQIREHLSMQQPDQDAMAAYALAHAPISAVTMQDNDEDAAEGETDKADAAQQPDETDDQTDPGAEAQEEEASEAAPDETVGEDAEADTAEEDEEADHAPPATVADDATAEEPPSELPQATEDEEVTVSEQASEPPADSYADDAVAAPETAAEDAAVATDVMDEEDIELPPLVDRDVALPPAPQIDEEGEITVGDTVEQAEEATDDTASDAAVKRPSWLRDDIPEPVPEELKGDPPDPEVELDDDAPEVE